jgi:hypothetical protein
MRIQLNEGRQPTGLFLARFLRALTVDLEHPVNHVELASHLQYLPGRLDSLGFDKPHR